MLVRQQRWRARWWGLLSAALVVGLSATSGAHSIGSGYFAHRFEVQIEPEWVRIAYTAEIPLSVLQREFVAMALRERQDSDAT